MNNYYILRFVRADGSPDEEYYYHTEKEAKDHFNLFLDDDSDLYDQIEIEWNDQILMINRIHQFV